MKKLHLPCLRGRLGDWTYYSTVMKIKDIVSNHRIITVSESAELYSKNVNEILQREISVSRIGKISNYLLKNDEHFFSSIVVAIHKGDPEWSDVEVEESFKIKGKKLNFESRNFIDNKIGILSLSGDEEIFALDGQHRLVGLRKALEEDEELGNEEISLVYVIHDNENKERTRRLFTVLNRYAEKPKKAELIILDEDDIAAINTRKLITDHKILSKLNALSTTKTGNLASNDFTSFTTLVTLYNINKILYSKASKFYTKRPSQKIIQSFYIKSVKFWDFLFKTYPEIDDFISGTKNLKIHNKLFDRNPDTGGSLLLRPVGQELVAKTYKFYENKKNLKHLERNLRKVDFSLSSENFEYLFWHGGKMIGKEQRLKQQMLLFLLGENYLENKIKLRMEKIYESYNIENYKLPTPITT